jgi:hypothetical protein
MIHTVCNGGGGGRDQGPRTDKHLPPNTFTGQFSRKADTSGFGVFIDIWSMVLCIVLERIGK